MGLVAALAASRSGVNAKTHLLTCQFMRSKLDFEELLVCVKPDSTHLIPVEKSSVEL